MIYFVIAALSFASLGLVIETIRSNKKMQAHPAKLILFICLIEATFCISSFINSDQVTIGFFSCYFSLDKLLLKSLFFREETIENREAIILKLISYNEFFNRFIQQCALISNMCLCHDLLKTL